MSVATTGRLHATLAAVCPIDGVSVGTEGNNATVRIDYQAAATAPQRTAAANALTAFDWSAGAQAAFDAQQQMAVIGRANSVRLTADVSNSTVNLADCTGLSFPVGIGNFAFNFEGAYTAAAATTGLQIGVNGPAASFLAIGMTVYESAIAPRALVAAAYDVPVLGVNSGGATPLPFRIFGNLTTTAAGLLVVRFRSEIAASAVTIKRGSYGTLFGVA